MRVLSFVFFSAVTAVLVAQTPQLQLTQVTTNLTNPVDIAHCGDNRLFVVEQPGYIRVLDSTYKILAPPFLAINTRITSGGERGLLGLAFHPKYAQNGWFFVNYTDRNGHTQVSRFSVRPDNPNVADPTSELPILKVEQPYPNHNGGCLKFGQDGYLYIGMGDGGAGGDPLNAGQTTNTYLGKFLRLDVDSSTVQRPYKVPSDNPFVNNPAYLPEIWSLGWRNPWRFSFDRLTGDLWVGDVGQGAQEEIDFEPAGKGGLNYGWRCREGNRTYNTGGCQGASAYIAPVYAYANPTLGCSVTGGFRYRGTQNPDLYGAYIFADYCTGRWWVLKQNPDSTWAGVEVANLANYDYTSLGEDAQGELFVAGHSGKLYRLDYKEVVSTKTPSDVVGCALTPNPTRDVFELQLDLKRATSVTLTLRDALQNPVNAQNLEGQNVRARFDLRDQPAGVYYLHIETAKGRMAKKVVKQ